MIRKKKKKTAIRKWKRFTRSKSSKVVEEYSTIACKNCHKKIDTLFCPDCGQNRHDKATNAFMAKELVDETSGIGSNFLGSLIILVLIPGELTLEYFRDKHSTYVSPVKLYLAILFLFFMIQSVKATYPLLFEFQNKVSEVSLKRIKSTYDEVKQNLSSHYTLDELKSKKNGSFK
jgi:hypothetical protein